jgi:hypothetical protein
MTANVQAEPRMKSRLTSTCPMARVERPRSHVNGVHFEITGSELFQLLIRLAIRGLFVIHSNGRFGFTRG